MCFFSIGTFNVYLKWCVIVYYKNDKIFTQRLINFEQTLRIACLTVYGIYIVYPLMRLHILPEGTGTSDSELWTYTQTLRQDFQASTGIKLEDDKKVMMLQ
jgi:hypothetical protein